MTNNNENQTMNNARNAFKQAVYGIAAGFSGDNREQWVNHVDDSMNVMTAAFMKMLDEVQRLSGYTAIKHDILCVLQAGTVEGSSKKSLRQMQSEVVAVIDRRIEDMHDMFYDEHTIADVKAILKDSSIVGMFFKGLSMVAGIVARKMRQWVHVTDDTPVIGAIFRHLQGFAHVALGALHTAWQVVKVGASFVGAAAIKVADTAIHAVLYLFQQVKGLWDKVKVLSAEDEMVDGADGAEWHIISEEA